MAQAILLADLDAHTVGTRKGITLESATSAIFTLYLTSEFGMRLVAF